MTESMTTAGSPWVYLFSRFTSEALLFEALIIFTLIALYSAFWLLRKRKYGVVETQVPAGVVKYYLNELIVDAEQLRAQLFGLLSGGGIPATPLANLTLGTGATAAAPALGATATAAAAGDPQAMAALEAKLTSQAKQIEAFIADKTRIEQELSAARAAKGGATAGGDPNALAKLQEKIAQLEGKLAEYSVIEDDLANLKRLQQENAALKAQLAGKGIAPAVPATGTEASAETTAAAAAPAPAPTVAPTVAPAVAPATEAPAATQTAAATPAAAATAAPAATTPAATPATATAPATQATPAPAATAPAAAATAAAPATPGAPGLGATVAQAEAGALGEAGFEGLVDQVEQSLQPQPGADPAAAAAEASTTPNPAATIEKSDADLVAEFEKMLNG